MQIVKPDAITTTGSVTRAGTATYYDQSGVLQTAATGVLRFGYDPDTKEFQGLIIEDSSTNHVLYSEDYSNAVWQSYFDGATRTSGFLSPTGQLNAYKITPASTGTLSNGLIQFGTPPIGMLSISVWLRADSEHTVAFGIDDTFGTQVALTTAWKRYSLLVDNSLGAHTGRLFQILDDINRLPWYMYGVQLEVSSKPTSYIKTTSSVATRNAEVITGSGLLYTNVTNPYPEWSSATTYSLGQIVVVGTYTGSNTVTVANSGTYKSLTNSNLNNNPLTSPTNWVRLGPTNQLAMFDNVVSSVTSGTSDITFVIKSTSVDSVAVLNAVASKVSCAVADYSYSGSYLGNVAYYRTEQLSGSESLDWYSYFFFDEETQKTQALYLSIPKVSDGIITVKITGSGTVSAGSIIAGQIKEIGQTQYGVNTGIIDYSRKETDEFGNTSLVVRNYSKRMNAKVFLTNSNLNRVQRLLYSIRATPVLWIGSTDPTFEEPLVVMGYYKDFDTEIAYPAHSLCNITVDGLI